MQDVIDALSAEGLTGLAVQLVRLAREATEDEPINPKALKQFCKFATNNPDIARGGWLGFVGDVVTVEYRFGWHFSQGWGYAARPEHGMLVLHFDDTDNVRYAIDHAGEHRSGDRSCSADALPERPEMVRFFEAFHRHKTTEIREETIDDAAKEVVARTGCERVVVCDGQNLVVKTKSASRDVVARFDKHDDSPHGDVSHEISAALGYVPGGQPDRHT